MFRLQFKVPSLSEKFDEENLVETPFSEFTSSTQLNHRLRNKCLSRTEEGKSKEIPSILLISTKTLATVSPLLKGMNDN